ncbi:MAG: helix-turn-helix transcriptional regulator [Lentisphaerae bacterium]|nr:helix-turn-helix transcriptional regulator [Lentisphaerota bacterium]
MSVKNNTILINNQAFLRLHLLHAAVGSWPCNHKAAKPVNIFFTILSVGSDQDSFIRDMTDNALLPIKENSSYFLPCNRMYHWKLSPEIRFYSIHFNMEFFYGFDIFRNYPKSLMWEKTPYLEELNQLAAQQSAMLSLCKLNHIIYDLVGELCTRNPLFSTPDAVHWKAYESVIYHVRKYGDASTRVEDLADIMKIRSNVFSRNFTRDLGITPKQFLTNSLLSKAMDMLRLPNTSIRQVAEKLNFSSEYYFSYFFKKNTGQSPSDFQRQSTFDGN